jgi:hypothetical protein
MLIHLVLLARAIYNHCKKTGSTFINQSKIKKINFLEVSASASNVESSATAVITEPSTK